MLGRDAVYHRRRYQCGARKPSGQPQGAALGVHQLKHRGRGKPQSSERCPAGPCVHLHVGYWRRTAERRQSRNNQAVRVAPTARCARIRHLDEDQRKGRDGRWVRGPFGRWPAQAGMPGRGLLTSSPEWQRIQDMTVLHQPRRAVAIP